jgi:anti-anti-sigma regulatory factor
MPGCTLTREVNGSTALYRIGGRFEAACAWDLSARLDQEPLRGVTIDFSRVTDFVDSAIAVLASSLAASTHRVRLLGLRQHQERLFRYFGVEPAEPVEVPSLPPELVAARAAKEVA